MTDFLLFAMGGSIIFRLIAMFTRESFPAGKGFNLGTEAVWARIGRGKGRTVDYVAVGFSAPPGWHFNLRRENFFDRFAKTIGLAREFQTRDAPFDVRIYIECDDEVLHHHLAARSEFRSQIFALFGNDRVQSITCTRGRFWFRLSTGGWDKNRSDEELGREAATPLQSGAGVLREQLAATIAGDVTSRDPTRVTRRHFALAILALAMVAVLAVIWQWFHESHQIVVHNISHTAVSLTIAAMLVMGAVMLLTLGGTAYAQRVLLDVLLAGIPAAWFAAYGGMMFLNEALDGSASRRIPVPVERSWTWTGSKNRQHFRAQMRFPEARARSEITLDRGEYGILAGANCVDVLWRNGWLGDGWIERYQTHNEGDCSEGVEK